MTPEQRLRDALERVGEPPLLEASALINVIERERYGRARFEAAMAYADWIKDWYARFRLVHITEAKHLWKESDELETIVDAKLKDKS